MSFFREYTIENPLLLDAKRFGRRFLGVSRGKGGHVAYLYLTGIIYLLLLVMSVAFRDGFSAPGILVFQTILMCIIVPSVAQGAVAGEREKRTWELLMAAPVARAQIVIGKYISVLLVLAATVVLIFPMILLSNSAGTENFSNIMLGEAISLGFGAALAALGVFISSITSRSLACQSLTYISIFIWLVMYPAIISAYQSLVSYGISQQGHGQDLYWMHPIYAIGETFDKHQYLGNSVSYGGYGGALAEPPDLSYLAYYDWLHQGIFYIVLVVAFLFFAVRAVNRRNAELGGS